MSKEKFKRWFAAVGRSDLTFHSLRKQFATSYLHANPGELKSLMELCGWRELATAERYLGLSQEEKARRRNNVGKTAAVHCGEIDLVGVI